jgi:CRISPR/Cas system-associated exonuclease Cas4 (RecB family)
VTHTETRRPPVAALDRGGRDYLSYSAVSLWQQCPLRFAFKYLLGLPEKSVSASLVLGSGIHRAIQHHYESLLAGNQAPGLQALLQVFWDAWQTHARQEILFAKTEDLHTIGHLADRMLRSFQRSTLATPEGAIVGIEEELRAPLISGVPDLLARVDLLIETDDALIVRDFKTARTAWTQEHVADSAGQLWLYSELVKKLADGRPLRLEFAVLTKTKVPELALHPVPLDPQQVQRTKVIVERVWRSIETGVIYPTPSALSCPTCPYREPCKSWTG